MQITRRQTPRRTGRASARRAPEPRPRPLTLSVSQVRARRTPASQDRALYSCHCGFAWTGEVTASPGCPHCGTPQAW
jgi:hypothetical protein